MLFRSFPTFEALWQDGEFADWVACLVQPLSDALGKPPKEAAP